ncbi:benzoylformate decarboxylase [Lentzea sp. NPDC004782]|uniref:benzoylformate decarboxylase n=1 Tax=Lentzea sp. NPDC004782 TaxID=3154458 RepID=UPI0033B4D4E1
MTVRPTVREAVVELLRAHGCTTIFGNPGSTELPLYRDFPDDFRYVLGLQESIALAMADGFAQATHNAAVVNLHSAAGVGHAMGTIFNAHRNQTPLIVISGQQARSMLTGQPYLYSDEPAELPKPYVKWSREPARAEDVPAAIARAYYVAMTPPRGPVLVSVPVDDWDQPADLVEPRVPGSVLRGDPSALASVAQALGIARNPAFVVGAGVDRDMAFGDVVALAESQKAAVWAAPMSYRCGFPETHPLFAGFLPPVRDKLAETLAEHDVVVVLGAPAFTYHVESPGPVLAPGTRLFQLVDDPAQASWAPTGTSVITSVRQGARDLLALTPAADRSVPARRVLPPRIVASPDGPITPELLVQTIADLRPRDSVIVEEAPSTRPVMFERLLMDQPESFYTTPSGTLGYSMPAAAGIALARADRQVIAVIGDGACMYSVQSLWSMAQLGLTHLTVVIVNNSSYATVDNFARRFDIGKPVGTSLPAIDFVSLARGHGVSASRVSRPEELASSLRAAFAGDGPHLVEVQVY